MYRKKTILQSFVYGREPLLLTSSGNPLVKSKGFTRHPPLTARVEEGLRGDHSWSPRGPPLPSDFKRRVLRKLKLGGCVFFRPQESRVPLRTLFVYRKKTILQSFVYGRVLLLTSSGNPLVKSKGFLLPPPFDGQSREAGETTRGLPERPSSTL